MVDEADADWMRSVVAVRDPRVADPRIADTLLAADQVAAPPLLVEVLAAGHDRALVVACGDVVAKFHHPRTDVRDLGVRLDRAQRLPEFLPPLRDTPLTAPDGRLVTFWPRVDVLAIDAPAPWADAGALLASLHRESVGAGLPEHGGRQRLRRALARLETTPDSAEVRMLRAVAAALLRRAEAPADRVTHGDWHLGQLGRRSDAGPWLLLDVDDLGAGDPAWDLARPAGFWAAGLLPDEAWADFLDSYRANGGPAVPPSGDPWPALDLPARAAVLIAATRELGSPTAHSEHPAADSEHSADALVAACARMHH